MRGDPPAGEPLHTVPVRHPGRWVASAVLVALAVELARSAATNPGYQWDVVGDYLFADVILRGVRTTLELTALSMLIGIVGGVTVAVMRLSPNPLVSTSAWLFIWVFRGTPLLVQLLFWNFLAALYPDLSLNLPFGPALASTDTNALIPTFGAALLGLGLNEAAYMAEIVRAGIISVDEGQTEAAAALGFTRLRALRHIVLPQAMRVIVPPTGNETIAMLKNTSLVAAIGVVELLGAAQQVYGRTFQTIPLLITASIWYLFLTSLLSAGQYALERSLAPERSDRRGLRARLSGTLRGAT